MYVSTKLTITANGTISDFSLELLPLSVGVQAKQRSLKRENIVTSPKKGIVQNLAGYTTLRWDRQIRWERGGRDSRSEPFTRTFDDTMPEEVWAEEGSTPLLPWVRGFEGSVAQGTRVWLTLRQPLDCAQGKAQDSALPL